MSKCSSSAKWGLTVLLMMTGWAVGFAQNTISGQVIDDSSKKGLRGVNISLKHKTTGVVSDRRGNYTIEVEGPTDTLVFSFVGFEPHELPAEQALGFSSVALKSSKTELEAVVIEDRTNLVDEMSAMPIASANPSRMFSNASIQETMNTIPGVRMDSRGDGGSHRLSIRGSGLRSPFRVRNIKMYWNNVPVTSPDGYSPLEVIDMQLLSGLQVIKGPVGTVYGSVNGGALLFRGKSAPYDTRSATVSTTAGGNGLLRYLARAGYNKDNQNVNVAYVHQDYAGYRDQEFNHKDLLTINTFNRISDKHYLGLNAYYFNGDWGLPGALTEEQVEEDPTQAVTFAVENNTRVERERIRVGLEHRYFISGQLQIHTVVHGNVSEKTNPFGTSAFFNGYKEEATQGVGVRTVVQWERNWRSWRFRWRTGAEVATEGLDFQQYALIQGERGDLLLDQQVQSTSQLYFSQIDLNDRNRKNTITLGANYNLLRYDQDAGSFTGLVIKDNTIDFEPQLLPRLGYTRTFKNRHTAYYDFSMGYSPPSVEEVTLPDGIFNQALNPEAITSHEIGFKLSLAQQKLFIHAMVYNMELTEGILPFEGASGVVTVENVGSITQNGIETIIHYTPIQNVDQALSYLKFSLSHAYQDYTFGDYTKEGNDYSGNEMTSSTPHQAYGAVHVGFRFGVYANVMVNYLDKTPLNDANTVYADPSTVVRSRVGYRGAIAKKFRYEVFAGVNNLTDEQYSSFYQYNGFGGRLFNPAPSRNFYGGLTLQYKFNAND